MTWADVKPFIAKIAPWLGSALGGPLGAEAGTLLGSALGMSNAKPDDVAKAIQTGQLTGDQIVAIKKAEEEYSIKMQAAGFEHVEELERLTMSDRDSARKREMVVLDWTPRILAYGVVAAWVCINGFLLKHSMNGGSLPADMATIIMRVLGTLDAALTFVLGYYFGSSSGSARKDELLQQSVPKQ